MISIVIPTYEQRGHGATMLTQLLNSIRMQETRHKFEVVISDNSEDGSIIEVCNHFKMLPIRYSPNEIRGAAENINNAISLANYDLVKIMCMDDVFALRTSLNLFIEALYNHNWVISNSIHIDEKGKTVYKKSTAYNHRVFDKNITGMPSVVAFRKCELRFDTRLKTACDMYFYYQLFEKYRSPGIIKEYAIGQRFWHGSQSRNQVSKLKEEAQFLRENNLI